MSVTSKTRRQLLFDVTMSILWFGAIPGMAAIVSLFELSEYTFACLLLGSWSAIGIMWAKGDEFFSSQNLSPSNSNQEKGSL